MTRNWSVRTPDMGPDRGQTWTISSVSVPTALWTATHHVDIARRYALVSLPLLCRGYQLPLLSVGAFLPPW